MKLIGTLELVGITLHHQETVLLPFEQLRFIQVLKVTSSEVSLPLDQHVGAPLNTAAKSCCLLLVCVCVDYQGKPEPVDLLHGKGIEVRFIFQVLVGCPILLPFQHDLELQFNGVILLSYCHNFVES